LVSLHFRKKKEKKDKDLFHYQKEGDVFAAEVRGTTFLFIPGTQRDERELSAHGSAIGGGGSYRSGKERSDYEVVVAPSGSGDPMPYEKWREQAGLVAKTQSAGAVLPEQVKDVFLSTNAWSIRPFLRPPSEYIRSRIRNGLELYGRKQTSPVVVPTGFVAMLTNTVDGQDKGFKPEYHPISKADIMLELNSMAYRGIIRYSAGSKIVYDLKDFRKQV
jgi:hypothetical protein